MLKKNSCTSYCQRKLLCTTVIPSLKSLYTPVYTKKNINQFHQLLFSLGSHQLRIHHQLTACCRGCCRFTLYVIIITYFFLFFFFFCLFVCFSRNDLHVLTWNAAESTMCPINVSAFMEWCTNCVTAWVPS